ncbi:chorismate synthase [Chloropicon primus]|nr:chorismate synthase [Chloropicon primus]
MRSAQVCRGFKAAQGPRRARVISRSGSTYGTCFRVTTFGESHGKGVGCVVDGVPPRLPILSGVSDGLALGTPIAVVVRNKDQRSGDYKEMSVAYRPSHADATYDAKYGVRAVAGGGRSSARETIGRVAAGAIAKSLLKKVAGTEIIAWVSSVKDVKVPEDAVDHDALTVEEVEESMVRCPHEETSERMIKEIDNIKRQRESCGGTVTCVVRNCPWGLGSPVFDKLEAELAKAMMSLPATKGFEIGSGFSSTTMTGSEHNDEFVTAVDDDIAGSKRIRTKTNRSGGIQGGISNGENIVLHIAFKPTSTIAIKQNTVTRDAEEVETVFKGRHDPCVVPRAVPMVDSMVAIVLADQLLQNHAQCRVLPSDDVPLVAREDHQLMPQSN